MKALAELKPKSGATHARKRVGRGNGSGLGGTSGKGHKGQLARTGGKVRRVFEGGQTPIMRRTPKFGFNNAKFRTVFQIVNLSELNSFQGEVTPETLIRAGLVRDGAVKILANGKLDKPLTVRAHKFSKQAIAAIESVGGKAEVIG